VAGADDAVAIADLNVSGPGWRWSASSASLHAAGENGFEIASTGSQTLSFTFNGNTVECSLTADEVRIGIRKGSGDARAVSAAFRNLTVTVEGDAAPITLASGTLRLEAGKDSIPAGSAAELQLSKLLLPDQAGSLLGNEIDSLTATVEFVQPVAKLDPRVALQPWLGQTEALLVASLSLEWGSLRFSGIGSVGLDDAGRPAGRFQVRIPDVLALFDSMNIVQRFDRDVLANTYAKLLLEHGRQGGDSGLPFTIAIADGSVTLSGQPHGIDDIALGKVGPLHVPAAAE
jgi:hypothetical protein